MQEDNNAIETSIDSGICDDLTSPTTAEKADNKMKTFEQILLVLERDKLLRAEQRKRLSQLTERRQRKKRVEEPCNVCCIDLDGDNIKSSVKCVNCQKIACRGQSCSIWIPSQSGWECQLCNQSQESISKSSEWLHQQITGRYLSPFSARSEPSLLRNHHSPIPDVDRRSDVASSFYGEQKERVREMIEETLGEMLGGSLDNISVNQLYKSRQYLPTWENGEAPGMSHIKLKRFIEKIINDAIRLPNFTNEPTTPGPITDQDLPFFDPKKYQELLATAVLNKIVDSYNYEQKFENNNKDAATDCSDLDTNHNALISRKVQSGSISSSSIEPESDCSITDPPSHASRLEDLSRSSSAANQFTEAFGRYDRNSSSMLTDYLNKHSVPLPDFSIESDSSNEDNLSASKNVGPSWEGNWLFKKKRPGHESPAPIGMLVPSPKEDIKTQIGDKTADELSDLSEAGSECGDNNVDEIEDNAPNALIQNRNIIGGKSPIGLFDELLEQTSLISSSSIPEGDSAYTETKNDYVLGDDLNHDLIKSTKSFIAEEAINSLVDTQTLQNNLSKSKENDKQMPIKANLQELPKPRPRSAQKAAVYLSTKEIPESELTSSSTASSGSIAEREHKKWYNAVEMPNNPYSREALKRRLSTTSDKPMDIPNINSPLEKATSEDKLGRTATEDETIIEAPKVDYKRYGRDYYINDAKCASGSSKLKLSSSVSMHGLNVRDDKSLDKEPTLQSQQSLSSSLSSLHRSHSWGDKRSNLVPSGGGGSTCDIFTARPVRVEESDPILSRATKLEYLSTPERDFYLLPSEEISSLRSISASEHSLSQAGDSLTPSEDSDTIRVYDLKKQETRLIRDDDSVSAVTAVKGLIYTNNSSRAQPQQPGQTPTSPRAPLTTQRSFRTTVINRGSTPTAFKFLQPKRRLYDTRRIMSEDTSSIVRENPAGTNGTVEKSVIEEDVIPALPSVKALAKVFQGPTENSNAQLNRPKSYSWKSVDVKTKEESAPVDKIVPPEPVPRTILTIPPAVNGEEKLETEPAKESYSPPYEQKYIPAESPVIPPQENGTSAAEEDLKSLGPKESEVTVNLSTNSEPSSEPIQIEESSPQISTPAEEPVQTSQTESSIESSTVVETPKEEVHIPKEPCEDSYSPSYDQKYIPAEAPASHSAQEESETIQKPTEEKVDQSNSLEWKEDNIEIVSTPKDEQHATPPNTPETEEHKTPEEADKPIIESISLPTETLEVSSMNPSHKPTIVEQFLENEKRSAMPPVVAVPLTNASVPEAAKNDSAAELVSEPNAVQISSSISSSAVETTAPDTTSTLEPTDVLTPAELVPSEGPTPALEPTSEPILTAQPTTTEEPTEPSAPTSTAAEIATVEPVPAAELTPESSLVREPSPSPTENSIAEKEAPTLNNDHPTIDTKPAQNGFSEPSLASPTQNASTEQSKQNNAENRRSEIRFTQESHTRDRPISPVLVPGKLKSSIAFFENLKNKK